MSSIDWGAYDHFGFALVAMIGTFLASAGLVALLWSPRWRERLAAYDGVAPPFINIIGVLFALTLAFLANDTWSAHDRATTAVYREADSLQAVVSLTRGLPSPLHDELIEGVRTYARAAVEVEWPLLAKRRSGAEAGAALDRLLSLVARPELGAALGPAVHAQVLGRVTEVREARDQRIGLSQTHVNPLKWLGMAFLGFVTMLSVAAVHVRNPKAALAAILLFSLAAAPTAAIVLVQGNPFQQPTTVSSQAIAEVARSAK